MKIVVLGGAGIIGRAISRDLAQDLERVVVADRDLATAEAVAREAGDAASASVVDVTDPQELEALLQGADCCVNSVNYYFNLDVMRACLAGGVPYLDLGGLFHMTRKQVELHDEFKARKVTAVLGMGSCPGVANVQAGWLAGMLDTVESVRIFNGSSLNQSDSLAAPYAIQTILDEISMPAMIFSEGEFKELPPLSQEEHYLFPEPIGWAKTHLSLHSEVATIPLSLADKGIQECTFKISFFGFSEAALRKLQFLVELGMVSPEAVEVDGARVRPREMLMELLKRLPKADSERASEGYKAVVTEVSGNAGGQEIVLRAATTSGPAKEGAETPTTRLVAGPAAIVARWLAAGKLDQAGVWSPERVIEPEPLFAGLADRGFSTSLARKVTIASPG